MPYRPSCAAVNRTDPERLKLRADIEKERLNDAAIFSRCAFNARFVACGFRLFWGFLPLYPINMEPSPAQVTPSNTTIIDPNYFSKARIFFGPLNNTHYTALAFLLACLVPSFTPQSALRQGLFSLPSPLHGPCLYRSASLQCPQYGRPLHRRSVWRKSPCLLRRPSISPHSGACILPPSPRSSLQRNSCPSQDGGRDETTRQRRCNKARRNSEVLLDIRTPHGDSWYRLELAR